MEKLKAAIVGCGAVTRDSHIPALRRLKEGVHLCALCDLDLSGGVQGWRALYSNAAPFVGEKHERFQ